MAIYEVVAFQNYRNQEVLNVYHYVTAANYGPNSSALQLLDAMGFIPELDDDTPVIPEASLLDVVMSIQSQYLTYRAAYARNLYDVNDFYEVVYPVPFSGKLATSETATATPALSIGFRSNRPRQDIRRGFKRFAGVTEGVMGAGGEVTGLSTELEAVAVMLGSELGPGMPDFQASPVVLKSRVEVDEEGKKKYLRYETEGEQVMNMGHVHTWSPYEHVRTQTSRQYGRGR